jgi:hypothetical protein
MPQVLVAAVGIGIALATLYVCWATYVDNRQGRSGSDVLNLDEMADQLADKVRDQWVAEAAMRRLADPYPLPVSWVVADASLADDWDDLVTLATTGPGWPPGSWPEGPGDLAATSWRRSWRWCRPGDWSCWEIAVQGRPY